MQLRDLTLFTMFVSACIGGLGFCYQAARIYSRFEKFSIKKGDVGPFFIFAMMECVISIVEPVVVICLWWFIGNRKPGILTKIIRGFVWLVALFLLVCSVGLLSISTNDNFTQTIQNINATYNDPDFQNWLKVDFYDSNNKWYIEMHEQTYMTLLTFAGAKFAIFFYFQLIHFVLLIYLSLDTVI